MGLRFDPVGGGQFKQAVKQIIEAERQPIKTIEARKAREEARLKLFQDFKSKFAGVDKSLAEFSNFKRFRELKVDLGDGANYFNLSFDKEKAEPGTYEIEINQLAKRSSVISNAFTDPNEKNLGVGYVIFGLPNGDTKEIFVGGDNASLSGIANLINSEKDSPVQAAAVQDMSNPDKPWRLIMTTKKDGAAEAVEFPELYFLDPYEDIYFADNNDAQNALIKLDGFELETRSNKVTDFLPGVTLQLKQAAEDRVFQMTITEDYQKISGKVKALVDQVNGVLDFINKQNQVDEKTDTSSTFAGDTSLQTVEYRLRNLIHEGFPVEDKNADDGFRWVFANQLGIEFNKTGQLEFKEDKFTKAMETDFGSTAEAITGENGLAAQMRQVMSGYTRSNTGMLAMREQALRGKIKKIDEDIQAKEARLLDRQQRLTDQFSRLQTTLSNLQRQSSYLSATVGGGGGGNLVSQLLGG